MPGRFPAGFLCCAVENWFGTPFAYIAFATEINLTASAYHRRNQMAVLNEVTDRKEIEQRQARLRSRWTRSQRSQRRLQAMIQQRQLFEKVLKAEQQRCVA